MRVTLAFGMTLALLFVAARPGIGWQNEKPTDYQKKSLAEWIDILQGHGKSQQKAEEYWEARAALGPRGPYAKVAMAALLEAFKDESFDIQTAAFGDESFSIETLADYGPGAVPTLMRALSRSEPNVRTGAIKALKLVDPHPIEAIPALTAALKDRTPIVRLAAAEALGRFGPGAATAVGALISSSQDTNDRVRQGVAEALYEIGPAAKPVVPALIALLQDNDQHVRQSAARALGKQAADAKEAVPALLRGLSQIKHDYDGVEFVRALGQIGPSSRVAVPTLIGLLGKWELSREAAQALGNIGPDARAAVPALAKLAVERANGPYYVPGAIHALGKIGPDAAAAVPALIEVLKTRIHYIKDTVIALGRIGPRAKLAMPALDAIAHKTQDENSTIDYQAVAAAEAAIQAALQIDPADAKKRGLDPALLLIRSGDIPAIKVNPRPKVTEAKERTIKALIGKLAEIEDPDIGTSSTLSGAAFAPLPDREEWGTMILTDHGLKHSNAFRSLVEIGPDAIPFLLEALDDKSPTRLRVHHGMGMIGGMWFAAELPGNPLNPLEKPLMTQEFSLDDLESSEHRKSYTVKVGDVCFVALGQIVGRKYQAVRYQPTAIIILSSPVHDKELREHVRKIWSSQDPAQKLLDSLLRDYATEGTLNGKRLRQNYIATGLQIESMLRLLYYFPSETTPLIAARLRSLDVKHSSGTVDFIEAVSWCKEPAIREALDDIARRTVNPKIKMAACGTEIKNNTADMGVHIKALAFYKRGLTWIDKDDYDKAVPELNEAIRLEPTFALAFIRRGIAWIYKKNYDKALQDLNEAIRLDPDDSLAFADRGTVWSYKKEPDKAIQDFNEAILLYAGDASYFNNRGVAWGQKKDYSKAIQDFNEAIRLAPKDADAFYNKACCYALLKRSDLAIENLRQSLVLGYRDFVHLEMDSDLDSIRGDQRYKELLEKYKK